LQVSVPRNHSEQNAPHRVKVGGIYKRIRAVVEKADDHDNMETDFADCELGVNIHEEVENVRGRPQNDVEQADQDHGLDILVNIIHVAQWT